MNPLPFSLNIFKQIEIFQDIKRLDKQFAIMLKEWENNGYNKEGLGEKININYPTWEIEKKILFWTAKHHKHLGSALSTGHLEKDDFLKDIHISKTEIGFSGKEEVLKNLVARGFATWQEGALISQQGLEHGLIIDQLYNLENENSIKKDSAKYRDERLVERWNVFLGYEFLYLAGIFVILISLFLLGLGVFKNINLTLNLSTWFVYVKYIFTVVSFLPIILFTSGICLIYCPKISGRS